MIFFELRDGKTFCSEQSQNLMIVKNERQQEGTVRKKMKTGKIERMDM